MQTTFVSAVRRPEILAAAVLIVIGMLVALTIKPYGWHVTSLFHIDDSIATAYTMPPGTVVLTMPGYDGMEYFQMARNMPVLFSPARWDEIRTLPPGPYAHQRFLLPLLAFSLSGGTDAPLPYAFLTINILSVLGTAVIMTKIARGKTLYGLLIALCPAAMVGMHFMLAEPLNLFLVTLFLWRYLKNERIDWANAVLLSLCVLTREINLIFVLAVTAYSFYRLMRDNTTRYLLTATHFKDLLWLLVPLATFAVLHVFIYAVFTTAPFFWSTDKSTFPLVAIWEILSGQKGYNHFTLSSIALFTLFVLPAFVRVATDIIRSRRIDFLPMMLAAFLGLMLVMPDHIWGSVTSIGRVITPVYPLFFAYASMRDKMPDRAIAIATGAIGLTAGVGLALIAHPYVIV